MTNLFVVWMFLAGLGTDPAGATEGLSLRQQIFSCSETELWVDFFDPQGVAGLWYRSSTPMILELENAYGQTCLRRVLEPAEAGAETHLALTRFPAGCYRLVVSCGATGASVGLLKQVTALQ